GWYLLAVLDHRILTRVISRQNLRGGATYLKDLLRMFEYDIKLALAAYNAGENAVIKYGKQIPPYPETQKYVKKVLNEFEKNRLAMLN
ncbi:MAG: lytic transglycosylase domain-containing protein, partial [Candidatus Thiodiazotropha taylori]|nr:lytic transglycosylase domain-containing protein [Candidatus Thiodiazotropha taylori]MCW4293441.1 lytic transglycosylase domain-containing protein [Candidatus Thiodiazotropha taylori]